MAETQVYNGFVYTRNTAGEPWRKSGPAGQAIPADPIKRQGAILGNQQTAVQTRKTAQDIELDAQRVGLQRDQAVIEAAKNGLVPNGRGGWMRDPNAKPDMSAKIRSDALNLWQQTRDLGPIVDDLEDKFRAGPGKTKGISGMGIIADRLPLPRNEVFDKTANKLRGFIKGTQGFTGGEGNTLGEMQLNIGAFIPQSSDFDQTSVENFKALRGEQQRGSRTAISTLGGIPDQNGQITPIPPGYQWGQNPPLDKSMADMIGNIPMAKRAAWMLNAQRLYAQKRAQRTNVKPQQAQSQSRVIDWKDY